MNPQPAHDEYDDDDDECEDNNDDDDDDGHDDDDGDLHAVAGNLPPPCSPALSSNILPSMLARFHIFPPAFIKMCAMAVVTMMIMVMATSCSSMHWSMKALATAMLVFTSASLC